MSCRPSNGGLCFGYNPFLLGQCPQSAGDSSISSIYAFPLRDVPSKGHRMQANSSDFCINGLEDAHTPFPFCAFQMPIDNIRNYALIHHFAYAREFLCPSLYHILCFATVAWTSL